MAVLGLLPLACSSGSSTRPPERLKPLENTGTVVVTDKVEIGPVAVTHKNLTIETGDRLVSQFVGVDSESDTATTQMDALLQALGQLKVPSKDVIAIIRRIHDSGAMYGRLLEEK